MARDQQSIRIRPWAVDAANRQDPENAGINRSARWDVRYEQIGGETPERLVFNQMLHELSVFGNSMNTGGILEWDAMANYIYNAAGPVSFVRGSDGLIYSARAVSGPRTGNASDPVTDNGTLWRRR